MTAHTDTHLSSKQANHKSTSEWRTGWAETAKQTLWSIINLECDKCWCFKQKRKTNDVTKDLLEGSNISMYIQAWIKLSFTLMRGSVLLLAHATAGPTQVACRTQCFNCIWPVTCTSLHLEWHLSGSGGTTGSEPTPRRQNSSRLNVLSSLKINFPPGPGQTLEECSNICSEMWTLYSVAPCSHTGSGAGIFFFSFKTCSCA